MPTTSNSASSHRHAQAVTQVMLLILLLMLAGCQAQTTPLVPTQHAGGASSPLPGMTPANGASRGALSVRQAQIIDGAGQPLLLRGAMIETSFAYIARWQRGQDPAQFLGPATFNAMASWHMNAVRINISYWVYQLAPSLYLSRLDQAVKAANAAGLYVILDYHDDRQSGNPAPDAMMHAETVDFWRIIAAHYKANPMMLFDPINEPRYTDWQTWLSGNGSGVVGYQDVIAAIRATGATQIIILEPGYGCHCGHASWQGVDSSLPRDQNIMFSSHIYGGIISGNPASWDAEWGSIPERFPIIYGEWAVLPHSYQAAQCSGLTSANADAVTNAFLSYLEARHANWIAWDFRETNLIQDLTTFAPTTFQSGAPWACGDVVAAQAGMGGDVKQFLAAHPH